MWGDLIQADAFLGLPSKGAGLLRWSSESLMGAAGVVPDIGGGWKGRVWKEESISWRKGLGGVQGGYDWGAPSSWRVLSNCCDKSSSSCCSRGWTKALSEISCGCSGLRAGDEGGLEALCLLQLRWDNMVGGWLDDTSQLKDELSLLLRL